jgi:nicotinamidase-related amidase
VAQSAKSPLFTPGSHATDFVAELAPAPGESVVTKSAAGGFTKTDLDGILKDHGVDVLVVAGLMTHLAVDSTARDGTLLGYRVVVVADATATRALPDPSGGAPIPAGVVQRAALASLADRFADVMRTSDIVHATTAR